MTTKLDTWESTMSWEETQALMDAADIEFEKGNEDEAYAILQKIPLAPELAVCLATQAGLGPEAVKKSGLNLKDAEVEYGADWLERLRSQAMLSPGRGGKCLLESQGRGSFEHGNPNIG